MTSPEMGHLIKRRHSGVSLLDLPCELRDMIYEHIPDNKGVFTYDIHIRRRKPHWNPDTVGNQQDGCFFEEKFGNPGVAFGSNKHHNAILLTCRTIYSEALPILYAATPLGLWRPMYDYGGKEKYSTFVDRVITSMPLHAAQHIRTLQLQGELFQRSMQHLLSNLSTLIPRLKVLDVAIDPYYDDIKRRQWLDDRAFCRQLWPAISTLHLCAQQLDEINITFSPPQDVIYIDRPNAQGIWLSGKKYKEFVWSYLQISVLRYELTIHGGIANGNAKAGMEFFMDRICERRDLFEIFQMGGGGGGGGEVDEYLDKLNKFRLQGEKEWMRKITGRVVEEVDEKEGRIVMVSAAGVDGGKWCRITYTASPRGFADPEGLLGS